MSIHFDTTILAIINFLVLVVILNKFLYKPITKMLDERKNEVVNNLDRAEAVRNDAEKMKDEYFKQMENAKNEAHEIIAKATKIGEETKSEIINEAKEEAIKVSAKAQEDIRREKGKALSELRDEVATLAVLAAEKIVGKTIDSKDHEKMVQDFVNEVGEAQ